jgi:hypothetical protein
MSVAMDEEIKRWNALQTPALVPIKPCGAVIRRTAPADSRIRSP